MRERVKLGLGLLEAKMPEARLKLGADWGRERKRAVAWVGQHQTAGMELEFQPA